jgi:triose/dihydroxyacetone kinase / FAD-AMP lyase (cyclizing)
MLVVRSQGWPAAVAAGVDAVRFYGGADSGMRTMLDALIPFSTTLSECSDSGDNSSAFAAAVRAARAGAEATRHMEAQAGRANYVEQGSLEGVPDPGAMAVAVALEGILSAVEASPAAS